MSERPATRVQQGELTLYLTYLTGREIATPNFYNIERFEPSTKKGFQRFLNERRANELADFLKDGWSKGEDPTIPTPAFLATDQKLQFDASRNMLTIDTEVACPFNVVDGQHRLEGVRAAVGDDVRGKDFVLPVTIADGLSEDLQMYHFFVINSTQKSVDQSLQQRITNKFIEKYKTDNLPSLPRTLEREVRRGTQAGATEMVDHLNRERGSPLHGRVQLANDPSPLRGRLKEAPLANMLKQQVYTASNPIEGRELEPTKRRIVANYLAAIHSYYEELNSEGNDLLIFNTSGMYFFLALSKWFFAAIYNTVGDDFRVETQLDLFAQLADEVDDNMRSVFYPDWWVSGREGSSMNRAKANDFVEKCNEALKRIQGSAHEGAKV